jgi:vitamin-K-epoxide reductase (warfarin-sensitive)
VNDLSSQPKTVSSGKPRTRNLLLVIAILSGAGIVVSAVSLQRHYARSATGFCDFGQQFNCDIVNRSEYSSVVGIPVAGIGLAGYAFLLFLSAFRGERMETPLRLLITSAVGFAFALYLTYIEAYVLFTWCILCLSSLVLIFLITALSASAYAGLSKTDKKE